MQVNENGLLSFLTEIPSFFNVEFPLDYPIISVFYADADCRKSGKVWYRTTADANLLRRAQAEINSGFAGAENFMPRELFIATWDQVGYYEEKSNKVTTIFSKLWHFCFDYVNATIPLSIKCMIIKCISCICYASPVASMT